MPATTQYVPFANGSGALVLSPTAYAADSQIAIGAQPGIARVDLNNTTLRQCSMAAAALTEVIANALNIAINDDGNLANLVTNLTNAIAALAQASVNLGGYARLASPAFTGTPTAPTPTAGDNSTKLATTAFVQTSAAISCTQSVVTGSRAQNGVYQNTGAGPMMVTIGWWSNDGASSCTIKSDSNSTPSTVVAYTQDGNDSSITLAKSVSFLVAPGNYYQLTSDTTLVIDSWTEWVLS